MHIFHDWYTRETSNYPGVRIPATAFAPKVEKRLFVSYKVCRVCGKEELHTWIASYEEEIP